MLRYGLNLIQSYVPPHIAGTIPHSIYWLFAVNDDLRYPNPCFKNPQTLNEDFNKGIAIYCLHGIFDHTSSFKWFSEYIIDQLPTCISSINIIHIDNKVTTFQQDAETLLKKIQANGDKHIILVGHSKGVLNCATFAEKLAQPANIKVHALMAITAPFEGSKFATAPLTLSPPIKQMELGSQDLTALVALIKISKIPYYYFVAGKDALLNPASCIIKENCAKAHVYQSEGHTSIMGCTDFLQDLAQDIRETCQNALPQYPLTDIEQMRRNRPRIVGEIDRLILAACYEIEMEIAEIKKRFHLMSIVHKVLVLARLIFLLNELCDPNTINPYPNAKDIREFVLAFLEDEKAINNKKPVCILTEQLNFTASFFSPSTTKSIQHISQLLEKHGHVSLGEISSRHKLHLNLSPIRS